MWFPLSLRTCYSKLQALSRPEQIAARLKECGYAGGAIADFVLGGVPLFLQTLEEAGLKGICGATVIIRSEEGSGQLILLGKGQEGWQDLMRATSLSHAGPNLIGETPTLSFADTAGKAFIYISGQPYSTLGNIPFKEAPWDCPTYEDAKALVRPGWEERVCGALRQHLTLGDFYVGIQLHDAEPCPASLVCARIMRHCAKKVGARCVALVDSRYCRPEDAVDHRLLLCVGLKATFKNVEQKLPRSGLSRYFRSDRYGIPGPTELTGHTPEELQATLEIAEKCEAPKLKRDPLLPKFPVSTGTSLDLLKEICRNGWRKKILGLAQKNLSVYNSRILHELSVIEKANLQDYFLIVWDVCRYVREELQSIVGKGRGSAAGCLISYLMGITGIDPVRLDLLFSRFYSESRKGSLPDIDLDFPVAIREPVIEYLQGKYGQDRVAQMSTFTRMQGRGALKDVLRVRSAASESEMNRMTKPFPDESAIADDLQDMKEHDEESSIILWTLQNKPNEVREWAHLKDGEVEGEFASHFKQAIRLEGTIRQPGKHPSGIIVCDRPLIDVLPLTKLEGLLRTGVDMRIAEKLGGVKLDILGLSTLDRLLGAQRLIRTGSL